MGATALRRQLIGASCALGVSIFGGTTALAAPLFVSTSFGQTYLGHQATLQLSLDINAAVGSSLGFGAPYSIGSGSVTFYFDDDWSDSVDPARRVTTTEEVFNLRPTGCGGCLPSPHNVLLDHVETWRSNPSEGATATVGGTTASGSNYATTRYYSERTSVEPSMVPSQFGGQVQEMRYHCKFGCSYWRVYKKYTSFEAYAYDPFSITLALDAAAIADLETDGVLGFSLRGSGDMYFSAAALTLDVERGATPPSRPRQPTAVPEPATASLLAIGFAMAGVVARRRRRAASACRPARSEAGDRPGISRSRPTAACPDTRRPEPTARRAPARTSSVPARILRRNRSRYLRNEVDPHPAGPSFASAQRSAWRRRPAIAPARASANSPAVAGSGTARVATAQTGVPGLDAIQPTVPPLAVGKPGVGGNQAAALIAAFVPEPKKMDANSGPTGSEKFGIPSESRTSSAKTNARSSEGVHTCAVSWSSTSRKVPWIVVTSHTPSAAP